MTIVACRQVQKVAEPALAGFCFVTPFGTVYSTNITPTTEGVMVLGFDDFGGRVGYRR
ncbi:hypothetical protein O9992_27415 [Vibrio lentus]|nr:hypothetical protein [Vibrio lentus]